MVAAATSASFALAAFVYAVLTGILLLGWRGRREGLVFVAAAGATAAWAAAGAWTAAAYDSGGVPAVVSVAGDLLAVLRGALWLLVAYAALRLVAGDRIAALPPREPLFLAALFAVALGALAVLAHAGGVFGPAAGADVVLAGQLALPVAGLLLVENLYRASGGGAIWATKHLIIGLGCLFAFDLFLYSDALLLKRMTDVPRAAQPLVAVLVAPLLAVAAVRIRDFAIRVPVSRRLVLQTTALIGSGIYLTTAAAAGYLLRSLGLGWGPTLQLVSLVGAVLVLVVLLASSRVRVQGRRFIERNFFSFAYDYREEWLRLVQTMTGADEEASSGLSLYQRAVKAAADAFDCDAGALFLRNHDEASGGGAYRHAASWRWPPSAMDGTAPVPALQSLFSTGRAAFEVRPPGERIAAEGDLDDDVEREVRGWLAGFREPWIVLGLRARDEVVGLVVLGRPRLSRRLTWEDHDLLAIFASQIGSYVAVEQMGRRLAETQGFERLSKHFSFVAHDLKNVVGQLSLVLQQAQRHADNPEFVRDALLTVGDAVDRMRSTLVRLRESPPDGRLEPVDLAALVGDLVRRKRCTPVGDGLAEGGGDGGGEGVVVPADRGALAAVLDNLVDNAREACGPEGRVTVALRRSGASAVVEIADNGPGMSRRFIEERLFQPFASTKRTGFGIGMYQCRHWVERWRGRLEVDSTPGDGTTVRLSLPLRAAPIPALDNTRGAA